MKLELTVEEICSLFNELELRVSLMRDYCAENKTSIKEAFGEQAVHLEQIYLRFKRGLKRIKLELTEEEICSLFNELEKEVGLMKDYCAENKTSLKESFGEHAVHLEQIYLKLKKGLEQ